MQPDEISHFQAVVKHEIPGPYRDFLSVMGRGAGTFLEGLEAFYPEVLDLTRRVFILAEEAGEPLPVDAVVIASDRGESFVFLRCSEGDEPRVYAKVNDGTSWRQVYDAFREYLEDQLNNL